MKDEKQVASNFKTKTQRQESLNDDDGAQARRKKVYTREAKKKKYDTKGISFLFSAFSYTLCHGTFNIIFSSLSRVCSVSVFALSKTKNVQEKIRH